ncbi:MAG: hypothetical protein NT042_06780 [Sulfuritalea sp.]|nr:hypothetical protein [Sulfuritalea sp.]
MMKIAVVTIASAFLLLTGNAICAEKTDTRKTQDTVTPVKWEYTHYRPAGKDTDMSEIMAKLNELGNDGWEVFSVNAHNGSWVTSAVYILKRRKQ